MGCTSWLSVLSALSAAVLAGQSKVPGCYEIGSVIFTKLMHIQFLHHCSAYNHLTEHLENIPDSHHLPQGSPRPVITLQNDLRTLKLAAACLQLSNALKLLYSGCGISFGLLFNTKSSLSSCRSSATVNFFLACGQKWPSRYQECLWKCGSRSWGESIPGNYNVWVVISMKSMQSWLLQWSLVWDHPT